MTWFTRETGREDTMIYSGNLLKMSSVLPIGGRGNLVEYQLNLNGQVMAMNDLVGERIRISWLHSINCIYCGREISKSFAQGYCYPCFTSLPETDSCILRPETCRAHLGISRDMEWSKRNCLSDHIVYLATSPGLKVGVTRKSQVPTRWVDQGASEAIPLAVAPDRYTAGIIEVYLKKHLSDKTNWRHMLTGVIPDIADILIEKQRVAGLLPARLMQYVTDDNNITSINYPVKRYPSSVKPVNIDTTPVVEGQLEGIKGQYLLFERGIVLNIRKFAGYLVKIEI